MNQRFRNYLFCCAAATAMAGATETSAAPTTDTSASQFCVYGNFRNCQGTGSTGPLGGQFAGANSGGISGGSGGAGGAGGAGLGGRGGGAGGAGLGGRGGGAGGSTGFPASQLTLGSDQAKVVDLLIGGLLSDQSWRWPSIQNPRGMGDTGSGAVSASTNGYSPVAALSELGVDMDLIGQPAVLDSTLSIPGEGPELGILGLSNNPGSDGGVAPTLATQGTFLGGGGGGDGINTPVAAPIPATLALITVGLFGLRLARQR